MHARVKDSVDVMVREFLVEAPKPAISVPLEYWGQKSVIWPDLSRLTIYLLLCPPTNIQSKRVFSHMGDILSPHHPQQCRCHPGRVQE